MEKRNISISKINGYTVEQVKLAKKYLDEIGVNKRTFPFKRLVEMYNEVKHANESTNVCSCQAPKFYNGILNYYTYGKLTLINNGLATEADFETVAAPKPEIENAENRINLGEEAVEEAKEEVQEEKEEPKKVKKSKKAE